ncbi:hypothetical protein [Paractinoplanes hotanensis]|uniref:Serine/threonine protein kinase n=1 Tax=Paractinoplanes hotanensis TaxID=2906497 RepID=A0ABT0YDD5_9ACTN|nr:hypothetical protein [Actinoplanes hotanensis]MCM4084066.1 hypothetical protein [Actinoplanes hotanensis]
MPNTEPSPDLERAFAALSSDTDRGLLLSGPELRRQAIRRRSRRVAVTAAAVAVLVAGGVGAGWALSDDGGRDTVLPPAVSGTGLASAPAIATPSPLPSSAPSSAPSSSAPTPSSTRPTTRPPAVPKSIPARALLSDSDAGISDVARVEDPFEQLEFCSKAEFPSEAQVGVRATVRMFYRGPKSEAGSVPDDTVYNTVTVYRGDGAVDYLTELRRAVEDCPSGKVGSSEAQFDWLGSLGVGVGEESVLIDRSYESRDGEGEPLDNGSRNHTYIAAIRIGDAVTLVDGQGYEGWGATRPDFEKQLAGKAASRLEDWRG